MPYVIVGCLEPGTEPLIIGRICQARLVQSNDGLTVHVVEKAPSLALILRNPGWVRTAWTYQLSPIPEGALANIDPGPYPDLSAINDAVERQTGDACAIRVSAQAPDT